MSIGFQQAEQVARNAGDRIGQNFHQISQENKIDQILKNAANAPNPQDAMNNAMTQILAGVDKESQGPVIEEIQRRGAQLEKQRQRGAQQQAGLDPDLPLELQKIYLNKKLGNNLLQQRKEERLGKADVSEYYKRLQSHINEGLKSATIVDQKAARSALLDLSKEEERNRQHVIKDEELETEAINKYFDLFAEKEEEERPGFFSRMFGGGKAVGKQKEKEKFDRNNPEHMQMYNEVKAKSNGNKETINELLGEMFT